MCVCSPPVSSPLLYHEARLTVFHEEVSGAVGISDGLSSPVQFHHVGTEDVYVVLALAEQPLGAPLLGDRQTAGDEEVGMWEIHAQSGRACSSELVLQGLCLEEGLSSFPSHTPFFAVESAYVLAWSIRSQVTVAHSLAFLSLKVFFQKGMAMQVCPTF